MSYGLLSYIQLKVLALRSQGLSLGEVARALGMSKQAVWSLERRGLKAVEEARRTVAAFEVATAAVVLIADPRSGLENIPPRVLEEADAAGVKLRLDYMGVYTLIRNDLRTCAERGDRLVVAVRRDGRLSIYCLDDVRDALTLAAKVVELA
jgi:Tfx family DNA-binding protein